MDRIYTQTAYTPIRMMENSLSEYQVNVMQLRFKVGYVMMEKNNTMKCQVPLDFREKKLCPSQLLYA